MSEWIGNAALPFVILTLHFLLMAIQNLDGPILDLCRSDALRDGVKVRHKRPTYPAY
jgi:hypothetical protein